MKIRASGLALIACLISSAAVANDEWTGLTSTVIDETCSFKIEIRYRPDLGSLIGHVTTDPDSAIKTIEVASVRPAPGALPLFVEYSDGPSCDPEFRLYRTHDGERAGEPVSVGGLRLTVPGDGYVYVDGHTNNFYSQRRKLRISRAEIAEIPQPFYYVGLETTAAVAFALRTSPDSDTLVSEVVSGAKVFLLACRPDDWCLVGDSVGIVGWLKLRYTQEFNGQLKGVWYAGD